jgi:hypothetical protein
MRRFHLEMGAPALELQFDRCSGRRVHLFAHFTELVIRDLQGQLGLFVGMKPRERVEVLLRLLGGEQRVILAKQSVEAVDGL